MDYRATVMRVNKLHALHRYHIFNRIPDIKTYPGQPPVLEYLSRNAHCTQAELADFLHVSPASVAVSVRRMEKAGLIGRRGDDDDRRCKRIFITEQGKAQLAIVQDGFKRIDERLFAGFTDGDVERLNGYLDRMIENLSGDISPDEVMRFMAGFKNKKRECGGTDD